MKKNYIYKSILCMALVCVLAGCPTPFSKQEEKTVTVTGQIQFKDTAFSLPQKSLSINESRSAFPTTQETVYYKVTAYQGTKSVEGDVVSNNYSVKLTQGKWIIVAKGYSDEVCTKLIFEGQTSTVTVTNTALPLAEDLTIIVSPIKSNDVNVFGSIALNLKVPDTIKTIRITWTSEPDFPPDFVYSSDVENLPTQEDSYYIYLFKLSEISTGSYDVQIDFYKDEYIPSEGNPDPVPRNIIPEYTVPKETINVFTNLTTDRWVINPSTDTQSSPQSSPWLVVPTGATDNTADFVLTQELINKQKSHSIYVDKTDTGTANNGTFLNPFKKIQNAIDAAIAQNDGEEYTIYIKNDYETVVAEEISSTRNNYLAYIKNTSTKPLKITFTSGTSSKVTIDANGTYNVNYSSKYIETSTESGIFCLNASSTTQEVILTLDNLILTGGSLDNYGSAVRNIDASSKMNTIIIKNCEIKNNFSTDCGTITTGKYLKKLQIQNTIFSDNTVYGSSYGNGGALYLWSKDNEINNCIFINNKACSKTSDNGYGGAVYVAYAQIVDDDASNTNFRNCTFKENVSVHKGSALFIEGNANITVDMENCIAENNISTSISDGAVRLSKNATLNIYGKNIIYGNYYTNYISAIGEYSNPGTDNLSNLCVELTSSSNGKLIIKGSIKESKIGINFETEIGVNVKDAPFGTISSEVSEEDINYIKENLSDIFIVAAQGGDVHYQPVLKDNHKLYLSDITHGYTITPIMNEDVTLSSLTSTIVNPGEEDSNRTVKFTLYDNTGNDVTADCKNWKYTVILDNSSEVDNSFIQSKIQNKITFNKKIKPGKLSITVSAEYKGSVYSTAHNVEVINAQYFSAVYSNITSNPAVPTTYLIKSVQDLNAVSELVDKGTITGENITLLVVNDFSIGREDNFTPLGSGSSKPFKGIFDGNGCTITNDSTRYLFGYAQGGTIRNLIVDSTGIISISNSNYASFGNKITDEIVENCINKASIKQTSSNTQYLAGLFINVTGSETGNSKISNCRNEGNLQGQWYAAGLFYNVSNKSIITGCINKGTVTIDPSSSARCSYVGGISNYVSQSEILNCANYGDLKITSYSTPEEIYIGCITTQLGNSGKCINCLNNYEVIEINGGSEERCLGGIVGNIIGTETIVKNNCCLKTPSNTTPIIGKRNDGSSVTSENNFYITTDYTDAGTDGNIPFIQDSATKVCTTTSAYSANPNKDVITLLNEWITSSTGGNDSSYATYKKWSYNEDGEPTF